MKLYCDQYKIVVPGYISTVQVHSTGKNRNVSDLFHQTRVKRSRNLFMNQHQSRRAFLLALHNDLKLILRCFHQQKALEALVDHCVDLNSPKKVPCLLWQKETLIINC